MQRKLLTLLFCVIFGVTVYGRSQIRLMNARYYGQMVDVTTDVYLRNNISSMAAMGGFPDTFGTDIPVSNYVALPNALFPLYDYSSIYAYDVDNMSIPIDYLAASGLNPLDGQSYTLVYIARSDNIAPTADVPSELWVFDEVGPSASPYLKIVNIAGNYRN